MIRCKSATRLLSRELDVKLAPRSRAALHAHLRVCPACTRCREQFVLLRRSMQRLRTRSY